MSGKTPRPGRVAAEKIFPAAPRKQRLVQRNKKLVTEEAQLTVDAGAWIKRLREERGLSQSELCAALGSKNRFMISMIETGRNHLSPAHFEACAAALGVPVRAFVKTLLSYYSPVIYELLLKDETNPEAPAMEAGAAEKP